MQVPRRSVFFPLIKINAIRSSHNPISKEMLEACDEIGMYVMDELYDYCIKTCLLKDSDSSIFRIPKITCTDYTIIMVNAGTLYRCCVELTNDGIVNDSQETKFGIRTIKWSGKGLFINGKNTLLRGTCIDSEFCFL